MKNYKTIRGKLMLPLCIGCRALIFHEDGGYTYTSAVVAIHSVQPGNIRFETRNTHYRLLLEPMSQAVKCSPAMRTAA